jgi:hypothetical protein
MAAGVRDAATANGLVMMMHANSFEAQQFAVNADVDVIAHGMWNWGALDRQPELPPEIKALLDRIVQKRTGYQATIQVMRGLRTTLPRSSPPVNTKPSIFHQPVRFSPPPCKVLRANGIHGVSPNQANTALSARRNDPASHGLSRY